MRLVASVGGFAKVRIKLQGLRHPSLKRCSECGSVYLLSHHWNSRPSICSQIIITHRFYLALVSTFEQTRCVFSSVHVGLLLCVHNTPNSDLAYRIFNMRKRSSCICTYVIFFGDCSQSDSREKQQQQKMP